MTQFMYLTKRNLLLYFRDRGAVFFSMLSMLIIIALMLFFLGDMHVDGITDMLEKLPGRDAAADKTNAELFMTAWTLAGIIPINAAMVALAALSPLIKDRSTGKACAICTSPVSRFTITMSYITAACLASVMICTVTLTISEIYLCSKGLPAFTLSEHVQLFGMILANSFTYSAIMYLCSAFVSSEGAWSGLGTVIGTMIGFLGGIYLPVGNLSDGLAGFLSCTPVIYGTVMFRSIMTSHITDTIFADTPTQMLEKTKSIMGIDYSAFGSSISVQSCVMIVVGFGLAFTLIGACATVLKQQKDR